MIDGRGDSVRAQRGGCESRRLRRQSRRPRQGRRRVCAQRVADEVIEGVRQRITLSEKLRQVEQLLDRRQHRRVIVNRRVDGTFRDVRRHQDSRDAHPELLEIEGRILVHESIRVNGRFRRHVIVDAAVLVPEDDKQRRLPHSGIAKGVVDLGDQDVAQRDVVRRMLIVCLQAEEVEIARFDETVLRQPPGCAVERETLGEDLEVAPVFLLAQTRQHQALRHVVKIHRPLDGCGVEVVVDRTRAVDARDVVNLPHRRPRVHEEPVRPRLRRHR